MVQLTIHRIIGIVIITTMVKVEGRTNNTVNQPKLCPNSSWNPNATTILSYSSTGIIPVNLFVSLSDTVFIMDARSGHIFVWSNGSINVTETINTSASPLYGFFVLDDNSIFISSKSSPSRYLERWSKENGSLVESIPIDYICFDIFVDIYNDLYCVLRNYHQIDVYSLNTLPYSITHIIGKDCTGSSLTSLNRPHGIFVTTERKLYVADCDNHRIQIFEYGQKNGTTLNMSGISLRSPTGVTVDGDGYIFIVEWFNRIIGSDANGFRCVAACSGTNGSAANELWGGIHLRFDSQGNIYVLDSINNRTQKFNLISPMNCTSISATQSNLTISTTTPPPMISSLTINNQSLNEPKLSLNASWNLNATTFATNATIGDYPQSLFISRDNTIVVGNPNTRQTIIWYNGSSNVSTIMNTGTVLPSSLFVSMDKYLFVCTDQPTSRIDQWSMENATQITSISVSSACYGLFIDVYNDLYCSQRYRHQVVTYTLNDPSYPITNIVGTGCNGSFSFSLSQPHGIFVTTQRDLIVADYDNNRIQSFSYRRKNAITLVGNGSNVSLALNGPTSVILDADGNLFIADSNNHRIVRSGVNGSRCILGCHQNTGTAAYALNRPRALSFDSTGNLFVLDLGNSRLQKFSLASDTLHAISTTSAPEISSAVIYPITISTGIFYNVTKTPCDILQPCLNHGTCQNTNTTQQGYKCSCTANFTGIECEVDLRICRSDTCLNSGRCTVLVDDTFLCDCVTGWEGTRCERRRDYCWNVTCANDGVCRSLTTTYQCECLGESYSGRHCELISTKVKHLQMFSRSMAFVSIIGIMVTAGFIILMDVLKYGFKIDLALKERKEPLKRKKKKQRRPLVVQHFVYVNAKYSE